MSGPPPKAQPEPEEQDLIEFSLDFDPSPPTADSLCGFRFPPRFSFDFGFNLPAIPACLLDPLSCFPLPWLSLNCDLSDPISVGWGGGKPVVVDPVDKSESDPFA